MMFCTGINNTHILLALEDTADHFSSFGDVSNVEVLFCRQLRIF
jgi:hypothetical protein